MKLDKEFQDYILKMYNIYSAFPSWVKKFNIYAQKIWDLHRNGKFPGSILQTAIIMHNLQSSVNAEDSDLVLAVGWQMYLDLMVEESRDMVKQNIDQSVKRVIETELPHWLDGRKIFINKEGILTDRKTS